MGTEREPYSAHAPGVSGDRPPTLQLEVPIEAVFSAGKYSGPEFTWRSEGAQRSGQCAVGRVPAAAGSSVASPLRSRV